MHNKKHVNLITLIAAAFCLLFYSCEEDKTCDEYTESNLIVQLIHIEATDSITLSHPKLDSVKFYRVDEENAILTGTQLAKATIFFEADSILTEKVLKTDTIVLMGAELDSIRLYSTTGAHFLLRASSLAKLFIYEDPIDSILIGGEKNGNTINDVFYNSKTDVSVVLPIDFSSEITKYTFTTSGVTDTFQISYSTETNLLSPTCGFIFNHTIKDDSVNNYSTVQIIDSVYINNKYVTPQSTKAHLTIIF